MSPWLPVPRRVIKTAAPASAPMITRNGFGIEHRVSNLEIGATHMKAMTVRSLTLLAATFVASGCTLINTDGQRAGECTWGCPGTSCTSDTDCHSTCSCQNGTCEQRASCSDNSECAYGEFCQTGRCHAGPPGSHA